MPDQEVEYLIKLGIDKTTANEAVKGIDSMRKGIEAATKSTDTMISKGRQISRIGGEMAIVGGLISAPFIAAANVYIEKYKGIETAANNYTAAQAKQTEATASLGRVAATALVPIMNQAADVTQKIADFASAHPDLVSTGLNIGAFLISGGAALLMAGQLAGTYSRLSDIIQSGGLIGGVAKAGIGIAALGVGLEAGVKIVNAMGDANAAYAKQTGDAALAQSAAAMQSYSLADALKTGRQIVALAIYGLAKTFVDAQHTTDLLGLTFVGVGVVINK
jgi:hypothetical protein